jgi:hypothetical protein
VEEQGGSMNPYPLVDLSNYMRAKSPSANLEQTERIERAKVANKTVGEFCDTHELTPGERRSLENMASGALAEPDEEMLKRLLALIRSRGPRPRLCKPSKGE